MGDLVFIAMIYFIGLWIFIDMVRETYNGFFSNDRCSGKISNEPGGHESKPDQGQDE